METNIKALSYRNRSYGNIINNFTNNNIISYKNVVITSNDNNNIISDKNIVNTSNSNNNDIRNETNVFLKSLFRDFRSTSEKVPKKIINFKRILKSDRKTNNIINSVINIEANTEIKKLGIKHNNNINNKKTTIETSTVQNNITNLEDQFPENTLENYPEEDIYKRILYITFGIIIFFLILSLKYFITEILQIPSFCDLRKDWTQFDLEVKNMTIVQLVERTCQDKCTFTNYVISKVFQFDHFIPTFLSNLVYFKNSNLLNKKIVIIYLILFPVLLNLLKFIVFFKDKTRSYLFITIINRLGFITFLFHSKKLFLFNLAMAIPLMYFSLVRLFFEFLFIRIYIQNPEIHKITIPIIISLLRFIYFGFVLKLKILKNIVMANRFICVIPPILYEFSFLGILHKMVEDGFTSKSFYLNILIDFIFDLNIKFQIFQRMLNFMRNLLKKKSIDLLLSDFEKIYMEFSIDAKIYSISIYFFLISFKYFNFAQTDLTDCFGTPLKNKVKINSNHFYLCGILIIYTLCKFLLKKLILIILKRRIKFIEGHFPKLKNKWHIFSYFIFLIFTTIMTGYPGFYFILNLRNT